MSEQQRLLQDVEDGRPREGEDGDDANASTHHRWRKWTASKLESKWFHTGVIALISLDSIIVLTDLSYSFLSDSCTPETAPEPVWRQVLSQVSLVITVVFLVELVVCMWAFGPGYYSPFESVLHFCDGSVIVATFVVEVVLRGRELELASLLIMFRLVRFAAEAAVGVGELNESTSKELEEKTRALEAAEQEIEVLRRRLSGRVDL